MKTVKTLLLQAFIIVASFGVAHATLLSDFNNGDLTGTFSNTWSGSLIQNSANATIGSPATDFGDYRSLNFSAINITGLSLVMVAVKLDSGNTATGFTVNLISGSGSAYAAAYFDASLFNSGGFTTVSTSWVDAGSFDSSNLRAWQITGGLASSTTTFRMSFDTLSVVAAAIPEPATYAGLLGAAVLAGAFWHKRRKNA